MVATAACIAVGSACCALAGVLRLAERVVLAIAPLRPPRVWARRHHRPGNLHAVSSAAAMREKIVTSSSRAR